MLSTTPVSVPKESGKGVGEKVIPSVDILNAENWISLGLSILLSLLLSIFYFVYNYYATMVLCYICFCIFAYIVFNNTNRMVTRYIFASNLAITIWLFFGHLPSPAILNSSISKYDVGIIHILTSFLFFKTKSIYLTLFQILIIGLTPTDRAKLIGEKETIIRIVCIILVWFFEMKQLKSLKLSRKRIEYLFMILTPIFKSPMYLCIIYAIPLIYTTYKLTDTVSDADSDSDDQYSIHDNISIGTSLQEDDLEDIEQPLDSNLNKEPEVKIQQPNVTNIVIEEPKKEDKKLSMARTVYSRSQGVLQLPVIKKELNNQKNNLAPGYYGMAKLDKSSTNNILQNIPEIKKEDKQTKPTILIESLEKAYR